MQMTWLDAIIMGIVEGLTEFLPISSTGHLILTASLLGLTGETVKVFEIAIQTGAMVAVLWQYRAKVGQTVAGITHDRTAQRFAANVLIAFIPAVVLGLAFGKVVKAHLFKPVPVALAFIAGAFMILWVERRQAQASAPPRVADIDAITPVDALKIGLLQCLALVPGTSRSGATIIGSMWLGLSRPVATEFSFFLGIPTLMGAGAYALYKQRHLLTMADLPLFAIGLVASFVSALICIRWLIRYVASHTFNGFAWYRIAFGVLILLTAWQGWVDWRD